MAQRSKIRSDRFSEKLHDKVHEQFPNFELASNDYKLSLAKTQPYLHTLFEGEAKDQHHSTSFSKEKSYKDAKENISDFFDKRTEKLKFVNIYSHQL